MPAKTTNDTIQRNTYSAFNGVEEMLTLGKGNLEAFVASGQAMLTGLQEINREALSFAQAQLSEGVEASRSILAARSATEAFERQGAYSREFTQKWFAEVSKLVQMSTKIVNESFGPLQARANVAMEKLNKQAAA
jgi:phasin family protein